MITEYLLSLFCPALFLSSATMTHDMQYSYRNGHFEKLKGLGWFVTGLFMVGG